MDNGQMRRGRVCWHRLDHVKNRGYWDVDRMERQVYFYVKRWIKDSSLFR